MGIMEIKKLTIMKKLLIFIALQCTLVACYDDYIMDYDHSAAYIAYQYDMRTFVYGEDVELGFTVALAGVSKNDKDRFVQAHIENALLTTNLSDLCPEAGLTAFTAIDAFKGNALFGDVSQPYVVDEVKSSGISSFAALPESYYTIEGLDNLKIVKGRHTAEVFLKPTPELFEDVNIVKPYYAIGFQIDAAQTDIIIPEKSFQVMAIKVENRFWGNWYHGGRTRVIKNDDGKVVSDESYSKVLPQADSRNYVLTTETVKSVITNKIGAQDGSLRLKFTDTDEIIVEDATNEKQIRNINGQRSYHNSAKYIQDREMYLNYAYSNNDGTTTYVTDTLVFRNRIRDGINEWQDENM